MREDNTGKFGAEAGRDGADDAGVGDKSDFAEWADVSEIVVG